jgi:hypothetical protein
LKCSACGERTSPTAGTIFDRTRTPLTVWFAACWPFASQKDRISALSLKRQLEIGSYQTAWAILRRLHSVLVRPGRERLAGEVEVNESYFGGEEPGLAGRAKGKKVLVGIAVERTEPRGFGRCRMAPLIDASARSLRAFLADNVEPGARVVTDGWQPYRPATEGLYVHERVPGASESEALKLLPGAHKGRLAGQALAARHTPGIGRRSAPARLPERVRVPLQPAPLPQPRARLLPRPRTRREPRPRALPRPDRQPPAEDRAAAHPAGHTRPPAEHGATASRATLEVQLDGYPTSRDFIQSGR